MLFIVLQNLNWNTFFQISTIFSFAPAQYLLILLLGLYALPYRSTSLDEFKTLFHQLGLDTSFDASRLSKIFAQINPLSKGHYIVGTKIQLLLVLCPDIFSFLYQIQNEFQSHFFNKKLCNRIINRLNNIERIRNIYKNKNKFPFPTCCDRLKYLLFNITNPYQYDYYIPDEDEDDVDNDDEEEEVYEYGTNNNNNNNNNRNNIRNNTNTNGSSPSSYTDDENNDSMYNNKRSRYRTSSDDDIFSTSKHKITFINIIEKFLYVIFPSRRMIYNNNGFCNKMVSRCKLVGESYSVEKYPRYPSHVSGTSFLSDSGILLDRQQQQYQQYQQHVLSGRGICDSPSRDNNIIGLNGIMCCENNNNNNNNGCTTPKVTSGRPYSGTLNTITFNYDTLINNNMITSPVMSPHTYRKKTSLHSDVNGILMKDGNGSIVNNIHQSEQLGVNYQLANRSYTNRQYSQSNSRCDYSLSPPHVNNKLYRNKTPTAGNNNNNNNNNIPSQIVTTTHTADNTAPTTIITTVSTTTTTTTNEDNNTTITTDNNNNNISNALEKNKISLQNT